MYLLVFPIECSTGDCPTSKEGDYVHVTLYLDNEPVEIPEEMLLCLKDEPQAYIFLKSVKEKAELHQVDLFSHLPAAGPIIRTLCRFSCVRKELTKAMIRCVV
jgi:hypothetical protein